MMTTMKMTVELVETITASVCLGALVLACGGGVSLGDTQSQSQGARAAEGGDGGDVLCPRTDCEHQGMACSPGMPRNLRCIDRGVPYAAVGDRCLLVGECPNAGDAGPPVRECETFPPVGPCVAGDVCRQAGVTTGWSEAACFVGSNGGVWQWGSGH
jgi:hypothetical protein